MATPAEKKVAVLLSASVEWFGVSHMRDLFSLRNFLKHSCYSNLYLLDVFGFGPYQYAKLSIYKRVKWGHIWLLFWIQRSESIQYVGSRSAMILLAKDFCNFLDLNASHCRLVIHSQYWYIHGPQSGGTWKWSNQPLHTTGPQLHSQLPSQPVYRPPW